MGGERCRRSPESLSARLSAGARLRGAGVATAAGVAVGVAAGTAATGAYVEPAPAAYPASAPDAVMAPPGASATVTDPATGGTCTISTSGYRWCWTP